jgi:hypothetical protein
MSKFKEIDIIVALTAPGTHRDVAALVEYLRKNTAGRYLLDQLANLLDENGDSVWQLKLERRDHRHVDDAETVERKADAFQRVRDLTGLIADRALIEGIVRGLQAKWRDSDWKVEPRSVKWLLQENGVTIADIASDKPLTEAAAKKITASEYGFSYGTFRDVYRDVERAMRAE